MTRGILGVGTILFLLAAPPLLLAEDRGEAYTGVTLGEVETVTMKIGGMQLQVPADLPIERKGGIVRPLSHDIYLRQKIEVIGSRIKRIDAKIDHLEGRLDSVEEGQDRYRSPVSQTDAGNHRS